MKLTGLDHLVLTVKDIDTTCRFYREVLGMDVITFGEGRRALRCGDQKINLHRAGHEFEPKARRPQPGSADLCFLSATPVAEVMARLHARDIPLADGPVRRTGARGPILSVYIRDPDGNLIEIANPVDEDANTTP